MSISKHGYRYLYQKFVWSHQHVQSPSYRLVITDMAKTNRNINIMLNQQNRGAARYKCRC